MGILFVQPLVAQDRLRVTPQDEAWRFESYMIQKGARKVKIDWEVVPASGPDSTWSCDQTRHDYAYSPVTHNAYVSDETGNPLDTFGMTLATQVYPAFCENPPAGSPIPPPPILPVPGDTRTISVSKLAATADSTLYLDIQTLSQPPQVVGTAPDTGCYGGGGSSDPIGALNFQISRFPACGSITRPAPVINIKKTARDRASISIDYEYPPASTERTLILRSLPWNDGKGRSYGGEVVAQWTGDDPELEVNGPFTVPEYIAPTSARQIHLIAEAAFFDEENLCEGLQTGYGAVDCGDCASSVGDPVSVVDGTMRYVDADPLPPILDRALVRTFDSGHGVDGFFGIGWTTMFDQSINIVSSEAGPELIHFTTPENETVAFYGDGTQVWPPSVAVPGTLIYDETLGGYAYRPAGGRYETLFDPTDGFFVGLRDVVTGRELQVTRSTALGGEVITGLTAVDSWTGTTWTMTVTDNLVRSITATSGLTWTYDYDTNGYLLGVTGPDEKPWRTYTYDTGGISEARDAAGKLIETHQYDASGRAISSIGPSDEIADIEYDLPGSSSGQSKTRITTGGGAVIETVMTPIGGAHRVIGRDGGCTSCGTRDETLVYDQKGRVIRRQDGSEYITENVYEGRYLSQTRAYLRPSSCDPEIGNCQLESSALATVGLTPTMATVTTTYSYEDPVWRDKATTITTTSVRQPGGVRAEVRTYDPATGQIVTSAITGWTGVTSPVQETRTTSTTLYNGTEGAAFDPGGPLTTLLALPQPKMTKRVDGPRTDVVDVTEYVYHPNDGSVPATARGRLAAIRNAAGHITRFETYDLFGNATRVVDPNGVAVETMTDAIGRAYLTTVKAMSSCNTALDPLCDDDLTTSRVFDDLGPLAKETRASGGVTVYEYDARGRMRAVSRGPSETDLREQLETSYDPGSGKKNLGRYLAHEGINWVEKRRESYAYDGEARLQTATHANGSSVAYTYDNAGRVATVRDENHTAPNTTYEYDPAGRLRKTTQTLSTEAGGTISTSYAYDAHGNLTSVTDPNGNITTYRYDDFGQMLEQVSPVTGSTKYAYQAAGQHVLTTDANDAVTERISDALGRVSSAISTRNGTPETVTWTYDTGAMGIGRVATMTDPTGETSYDYDRRGLLVKEAKSIGEATHVTSFGYDVDGNRSRIRYPSARVVDYTFDYAGRPFSASIGSTQLVASAAYLPFGPQTEVVFGNGTTKSTTYDDGYRLDTNALLGPSGVIASYDYGHDAVGNITHIHDLADPSYNRDFGYDDINRLTTASSGASLWGTGTYQYDAMGNLQSLSLGTRSATFTYDGSTPKLLSATQNAENRIVTYDSAGNELAVGSTQYGYSPRNQLVITGAATYGYDGRGVRVVTSQSTDPIQVTSLSADKASPQPHGTVLTWTANATGGIAPLQYRFSKKRHAAVDWEMAQNWSDVNVHVWTPGASDVGDWSFKVEVRSVGGTESEASLTSPFTVSEPITVTALTANMTSPQPQGTTILWTPETTGGVAPLEYRYWRKAGNASTWELVQDWTPTSTYTWTPGLPDVGSWEIHVNVRSAGAVESEAYRTVSFMVSAGEPIVISALVADRPSPQWLGATITWTPQLTGGIGPLQYRYWIKSSSDAEWTLVQDWSTTATFTWIPVSTQLGDWNVHVNVRSAGVVESEAYFTSAVMTVASCATELPPPVLPDGEVVWVEDAMPPQQGTDWMPWTTAQKASGAKSIWLQNVSGPSYVVTSSETPSLTTTTGDNLSFYMLLNSCSMPRAVRVEWYSVPGGWKGVWWGEALLGGETGFAYQGPMPAGGTWTRFEFPSILLGLENKGIGGLRIRWYDGEAWLDRISLVPASCTLPAVATPTIPPEEVPWIDDAMPPTNPDVPWSTVQKASGSKSIWVVNGPGAHWTVSHSSTPSLTTTTGDKLSFYMLLNECSMPRAVRVEWSNTTSGWKGVWWGEALLGQESDHVYQGAMPAGGGWTRFELPSSALGLENKSLNGIWIRLYDGEAWFDRFAVIPASCATPVASAPAIPPEEVPWIDDAMPAPNPDVAWSTAQKASGSRSIWVPNGAGAHWTVSHSSTPSLTTTTGDKLSFYMLLNECSMPRAVRVEWSNTTSGWKGVWWGEALLGQESNHVYQGPMPAGGGWTRFEIPASALGLENKSLNGIWIRLYDGEAWFDRFAVVSTVCTLPEVPAPTIAPQEVAWIDDEVPGQPTALTWSTDQKASGARSVWAANATGTHEQWTTTPVSPVLATSTGDRLTFYMLLNPCTMPREVIVYWHKAGGNSWRGARWGENLINAGATVLVDKGSVPAGGVWHRFELSAAELGLENASLDQFSFGLYDGEGWLDRVGKLPSACQIPELPPPTIQPSEIVWIDDEVPGQPSALTWSTAQKASGARAVWAANAPGLHEQWTSNPVTPALGTMTGDKLSFYMLLNPCAMPREAIVYWYRPDNNTWRGLRWGENLVSSGAVLVDKGPLPAGGVWHRFEVSAAEMGLENADLNRFAFALYDGEGWMDRIARVPSACQMPTPAEPATPPGELIWIDDEVPGRPTDLTWSTAQKVMGSRSVYVANGSGAHWKSSSGASPVLSTFTGDKLSVYVLLNPCAMPREVRVAWYGQGYGQTLWRGVRWGESLMGSESSYVGVGEIPAGGIWHRFEFDMGELGLESMDISGVSLELYDGEAWFDGFGLVMNSCRLTEVTPPAIAAGETVWIDDEVPGLPNTLTWSTRQKVSGARAIYLPTASGGRYKLSQGASPVMATAAGDKLTAYLLLNPCAMPREVRIAWYSSQSGWVGARWGEALMTNQGEYRDKGALPTGGAWYRVEIPASELGLEGADISGVVVEAYDGEVWFDAIGKVSLSGWHYADPSSFIGDAAEAPSAPISLSVTARYVGTDTIGTALHSIYTPELSLLSEAEVNGASVSTKADYVWFGGAPVAQIDGQSGAIDWYFTDHLGTPILQTDASAAVVWRAELEPYGDLYSLRAGSSKYQPLRFPGQESHDAEELSYNIFRWYRSGWGRYTQPDPLGLDGGVNLYRYAAAQPSVASDRLGLSPANAEYCRRLLERIQNLQKKIDERIGELDEDPLELPEAAPGDDARPSLSRRGHRRLIDVDKAQLAARKAEYLANCKCDPPNGSPSGEGFGKFFSREQWESKFVALGSAVVATAAAAWAAAEDVAAAANGILPLPSPCMMRNPPPGCYAPDGSI